jgi:signal transduction histidine kinase
MHPQARTTASRDTMTGRKGIPEPERRGLSLLAAGMPGAVAGGAGVALAAEPGTAVAEAAGWLPGALGLAGLAVGVVAAVVAYRRWHGLRKKLRSERQARQAAEARADELEALLAAEPHVLVIWEGGERHPRRFLHLLPEGMGVPVEERDFLDLAVWLETDSAARLRRHLSRLREEGKAFNIAVTTREGQLLEADGRVSGARLLLRLRPVFGERREAFRLTSSVRRSEQRLKQLTSLLDAAPVPVWMEDRDGRLLWANRRWREAVEEPDLERAMEAGLRLVEPAAMRPVGGDAGDGEGARGERRWHASTVIGGQRRLLEIHESRREGFRTFWAIDITEVENLRRELKNLHETQTGTLDSLTTAIAIFGPDQRLHYFNPAFARLWRLDADWLRRQPTEGEILDRLHDQGRLQQHADFREWKAARLALYTSPEGSEERWHLPDGRTIRVITQPHAQGGILCIYDDITEKLKLESQVRGLMQAYRETLDNLHEGIALFGPDGRLRLHNPAFARMWHLKAEELEKAPHITAIIDQCRHLVGDDAWWDRVRFCVTGIADGRKGFTQRIETTDQRVFDFAAVPLPDGNTLLSWVDMTAAANAERILRERNEALLEADRMKSAVLNSISYHLRNPLNAIVGFTQSMEMGIAGELNEKQREYLHYIRTSSSDLMAVIDTILDLATIDAGRMTLDVTEVDIREVLEEVARRMEERLETRDLKLEIDIAEDARRVWADRQRLMQILSQLLSNAIGFSDAGRKINMGARRGREGIEIWVADEGPGIDPEFLERAFDRFASRPVGGGHRGPGLGLPLVKGLVELHGGRVELVSRIGKGTTVICRFPSRPPQARAEDEANAGGAGEGKARKGALPADSEGRREPLAGRRGTAGMKEEMLKQATAAESPGDAPLRGDGDADDACGKEPHAEARCAGTAAAEADGDAGGGGRLRIAPRRRAAAAGGQRGGRERARVRIRGGSST